MKRNNANLSQHQKRQRWEVRNHLCHTLETREFRVKWDDTDPTKPIKLDWKDPATAKEGAEKQYLFKLNKAQTRGCLVNEHKINGVVQELRQLLFVKPISNQGGCVSLLQKAVVLRTLYPGEDKWRLHYDASGAGYTTVALSPILGDVHEDLSPRNLWRLAIWHGKEGKYFHEYLQASNLVEELRVFQQQFGSITVISDWEGLRVCSGVSRPCTRALTDQCCSFCSLPKRQMVKFDAPSGTGVSKFDALREVAEACTRIPCIFHGMRVYISWLWDYTIAEAKSLVRGAATKAMRLANQQLKMEWSEGHYLSFDVFQEFVQSNAWMHAIRELQTCTKKVPGSGRPNLLRVDIFHKVWKLAKEMEKDVFSYTPNVEQFQKNCQTSVELFRLLGWEGTVWSHCVVWHFPFWMVELGTLAPYDNRAQECQHAETNNLVAHSTHGQVHSVTGRTGYMEVAGKDTERLFYTLKETFGEEKARSAFEQASSTE